MGGIKEHQRKFEKLRAQTRCSKTQALDMFLGGMSQKLKKLVVTSKPISVLDAYNLAKLHKEALHAYFQPNTTHFFIMSSHYQPKNTNYQQKPSALNSPKPTTTRISHRFHRENRYIRPKYVENKFNSTTDRSN